MILLIEDRDFRQKEFEREFEISLDSYSDILDNKTQERYLSIYQELKDNNCNLEKYTIIICHKSAFGEDNNKICSYLIEHCKKFSKPLIFFSGGINSNYYNRDEYELIELNSKIFYSQNLKIFLDDIRENRVNILILSYGYRWKLNILLSILERIEVFIESHRDEEDIDFDEFSNGVKFNLIETLNYKFYDMQIENNFVYPSEILKFKESLKKYIDEFVDE